MPYLAFYVGQCVCARMSDLIEESVLFSFYILRQFKFVL